jgi:glycosyltransferase involved in cell wall biosynthesis
MTQPQVAVVIPAFKVRDHILTTLAGIGPEVAAIYVVDDACPENSGEHVRKNCADARVRVIRVERHLGVGGATTRGYREALGEDMDILVKLHADGRMDPARIASLVRPLLDGQADYAKGNRFFDLDDVSGVSWRSLIGNAVESFLSKVASGYWDLTDPGNGFTALHGTVARAIGLDKIARDEAFESDVLFRLAMLRAVVVDVPMPTRISRAPERPRYRRKVLSRAVKRLAYGYFLRDFNAGTLQFLAGIFLTLIGAVYGGTQWYTAWASGFPASAGTVMLAALPVLIGVQLLISAFRYEVTNVPRRPLHPHLVKRKEADLSATGWVRQG